MRTVSILLTAAVLTLSAAKIVKKPVRLPPAPPVKASATVRRWIKSMTLRDEVAQLVFIPFYGTAPNVRTAQYRKFVRLIHDTKVGGLILLNASNGRTLVKAEPHALGAFLNRMQRLATVPLMVGADFERGASMRMEGVTVFPHAMAFGATGDPSYSRLEGQVTAREARAMGIQWVYYPVADVNNNPDNPIINIRSFGENPKDVAANVRAFIEGAHSDKKNYVLATAKHFPGHGDTATDSHVNLPTIPADRARMDALELVPFRAAIEAGADSIMTAHVAVPALSPPDLPATLSPAILTGLLRKELDFKGLVITDALEMAGVAQGFSAGEAAVRAIEAGADTLLMPSDPDAAIRAVVGAVEDGRISLARLQESVVRILQAKEKVGLDRKRFVDLEGLSDVVDDPEANAKALEIASRAVTLVRNAGKLVPLASPEHTCFLVMSEGRYSTGGQAFAQEVHKRLPRGAVVTVDPSMSRQDVEDTVNRLQSCDEYAVAAFASVTSGRGSVALSGDLPHAMEMLQATGKPVVLTALGNPYLLRSFPWVGGYLATYSTVPPSEVAAAKALWGEIPIGGHLPVSIPGLAGYGEGIALAASRPAFSSGPAQ